MKFRKNKKGFTIVELIIVIAVIGILTAVMVPTIVHLVNKANKASDDALVSNLNKAVQLKRAEPGAEDPVTMHETVLGLKEYGYDLDALVAKSDQNLLYDLKDNKFLLEENAVQEKKDSRDYWKIQSDAEDQTYNIYAAKGFAFGATKDLLVGFDVGYEDISSISYKSSAAKTAVIRTNGGKLTVEAPEDVVNHYGVASEVEIKEVASSSYHLFGEVTVKLTVGDGRAVVENGGKVATLEVAKGAEEVVAEAGSTVDNLTIASDADIVSEKLEVKAGAEVNIVVNNSDTVETTAIEEAGVNVVETGTLADNVVAIKLGNNSPVTSMNSISKGDYLLVKDCNASVTPTQFTSGVASIDLNGHTITNTFETRHAINNCRALDELIIKGVGKIVQTSTNSNYAALYTKTGLTVGEGVEVEGGAVGVWAEGTTKAYTVNFAGSYKTSLEHSFGFYRNGTNKDTTKCPTINIAKTAKVEVEVGAAIYGAGYAVWNIEGGEFKSNECLEFKSGIVNISGGRFETTAAQSSHTPNGNGTSANGYALAAIWNDGYAKPLTVTLDGGTFVGPVAKLNDSDDPSKINSIVFNNNINVPLA